jgi:hypothetical protein
MTRWLLAVLALAGCSPTLDWRELRPEGGQAQASLPCKPASHARRVTLAGVSVQMSMYACSAAGTTFALTFADLGDPALVSSALAELATAVATHVRASAPAASQPFAVRGMTPNANAALWHVAGTLPDGRAVQERAALFAHGTSVYQATMLGPTLDVATQEAFFGALRIGP